MVGQLLFECVTSYLLHVCARIVDGSSAQFIVLISFRTRLPFPGRVKDTRNEPVRNPALLWTRKPCFGQLLSYIGDGSGATCPGLAPDVI